MRLEIGMLIKTSYSTGPYRIIGIKRGCTCSSYLDSINMKEPPLRSEHIHLSLCNPEKKRDRYWLSGYDEESLASVDSEDYLILLPQDKPIQSIFL